MHRYPALRLLIPLAAGVILGDALFFENIRLPFVWFLSIAFFLPVLLIVYRYGKAYTFRWLFGVFTYLFFVTFGAGWANIRLQQVALDYPSHESVYRVVITEQPVVKENSILCSADVLEQINPESSELIGTQAVLLHFPLDSAGYTLQRGDELLVSAHLSLPLLPNNPDEFDYPRYLLHKGVGATAFVASGKWRVVDRHTGYSLRNYAYDCRDKVLKLYREVGFKGDNFAVLSALTVGYKDELSEEVRESFSITGASHVLALSGLHVGFLYILLFFLLKKLPGSSMAMELFRTGTIILLLWIFAFITGLSPSVVRAVIMFSILGLSLLFSERAVSLNTLSVAAMGMLIYNPSWLFDVGFQLSFVAVAAILFIQPWLYRQLIFRQWLPDKVWALATVSIAAQIGTAPLVLFYFSRFPVHFLLTNVLVVPLVTLIIYAAIVLLALSFVPIISQWIAYGLNLLLDLLNGIVRRVEQLPFTSVDGIWVYHLEVVLVYVVLFLLGAYVVRRKPRLMIACLSVILAFGVYHAWMTQTDAPEESLVFYHARHCPAVHCISANGKSWLAYADSLPDEKRLARIASNYWNRLRLSAPVAVTADYTDDAFIRRGHILSFGSKKVCIVNHNLKEGQQTEYPSSIDYVYLCRGYTGRLVALTALFDVRHVVLDASVSDHYRDIWLAECKLLGIPFTSLAEGSARFRIGN